MEAYTSLMASESCLILTLMSGWLLGSIKVENIPERGWVRLSSNWLEERTARGWSIFLRYTRSFFIRSNDSSPFRKAALRTSGAGCEATRGRRLFRSMKMSNSSSPIMAVLGVQMRMPGMIVEKLRLYIRVLTKASPLPLPPRPPGLRHTMLFSSSSAFSSKSTTFPALDSLRYRLMINFIYRRYSSTFSKSLTLIR